MQWPHVHARASPWASEHGTTAYSTYIEPRPARLATQMHSTAGFSPRNSLRLNMVQYARL